MRQPIQPINKNLLKSKILLKGLKQKELAEKLNINVTSLNIKLNNNTVLGFSLPEIKKLKDILMLSDNEVVEIFLS